MADKKGESMIEFIDTILDRITMYRLVLYYLLFLIAVACIFGLVGILHYNPLSIIISTVMLIVVCWITNKVFSFVFHLPANVESLYITALILALILTPITSVRDIPFFFWAAVLAISSKYVLAIKGKHIFNPVAIGVFLTAFGFNGNASWWIGTIAMLPFSLMGVLILRKISKYDLVVYFFLTSVVTTIMFSFLQGNNLFTTVCQIIYSSPIFFFAFVMLTEPLTTPSTKKMQSVYGAIVGLLFAPRFHLASFYTTPELALVIGNIFSYIVSPKLKILSAVQEKIQLAPDMLEFVFPTQKNLAYLPGQYMEWTVQHKKTDSRGNRRYFTIASSPTEDRILLGIKFYQNGSSYKKALQTIDGQTQIAGGQLSGDFVLPKNVNTKLAFIAGGIGITPFRSMIKYLIDTKQKRPVIILYSNKNVDEIVYNDIFAQAYNELGIPTWYTLTDAEKVPPGWQGKVGRIDGNMIQELVPDFMERTFYISGPHAMVTGYKDMLRSIGVPSKLIKTDFFPGFV